MSSSKATVLAAVLAVLPISAAHALIYKVEFDGLITSSPHTETSYEPLALGASLSGSFFYDTAWDIFVDDQFDPNTGRGFGPIDLKVHSASGSETWLGGGFAQFELADNEPSSGTEDVVDMLLFNFFQHPAGPFLPAPPACVVCDPIELRQISLVFFDQGPSTPFMTSPGVFPVVDGWHSGVEGTLLLEYGPYDNDIDIVASLSNYRATVVPEPAEWAFMLGGLALTAFILKRRARD